MRTICHLLLGVMSLLGFVSAVPAPAPTQTAAACVHDQCSKVISQTPHKPMCPAYLAAGPGKAPAPPTYTMYEGCNAAQIYSVCSCFFQPTTTSASTSATSTSPVTTTDAPSTTAIPTTSTSTAAPTSTSLSPESPSPCPYPDHSNVTTGAGNTYEVLCGYDVEYNDEPNSATYAATMEDCINACDEYEPAEGGQSCAAVTFTSLYPTGINCYLHYSTEFGQNSIAPYYDSAILVSSS